jgi:hypothetical protein
MKPSWPNRSTTTDQPPDRHQPAAARSDKLITKRNALAQRLINRQADYLRFTRGWRVVPDNNGGERDRQAREALLRRPRHARRRSSLDARNRLILNGSRAP